MVSTPQMGDYPPGCDGPPEEAPMTESDRCDQIADEISDDIFDWRVHGEPSGESMEELQDIITKFIKDNQ